METIVKYRFDREMVAFVKTLDIKTAMFGYDKSDVYDKFKDLLVKARDVCEELVQEVCEEAGALKETADDPVIPEDPVPAADAAPVESGENGTPDLLPELLSLREENKALQERLQEYVEREELLRRAHDIVSEARLEREAIIRNAQKEAEEELFLFRARKREEESGSREELEALQVKRTEIKKLCDNYRAYAEEGQSLFVQLQAFTAKLDQIEDLTGQDELSAEPAATEGIPFDPPQLSPDESLSCTEESMPLCEIVDQEPEGIFRGQDPADDPSGYENEPGEADQDAECPHQA